MGMEILQDIKLKKFATYNSERDYVSKNPEIVYDAHLTNRLKESKITIKSSACGSIVYVGKKESPYTFEYKVYTSLKGILSEKKVKRKIMGILKICEENSSSRENSSKFEKALAGSKR